MSSTAEAAAALLAQVSTEDAAFGLAEATQDELGRDEAGQDFPSSPEVPVARETAHETADVTPDFMLGEPEPEDADWLEPDIEDDEPIAASVDDDEFEASEFVDEETARLRKRAQAAEKKAAFYEQKAVTASRKGWEKEAAKYYPLADLTAITATSRRAFMRDAKAGHDRLVPTFNRFKEAERAKLRAEAAEQWGAPVQGGRIPSAAAAKEANLAESRRNGATLGQRFRTMLG